MANNEQLHNTLTDAKRVLEQLSTPKATNDMAKLSQSISTVVSNSGTLFFTGIGKTSFLAMKNAATCKSVAVKAEYLDANAVGHGDLGSIPLYEQSILIAISKSGLSKELYAMFAMIRKSRPKCKILMICMSTDDQLRHVKSIGNGIIDDICVLPLQPKELDSFGMIPSISNAMFEIAISAILSEVFYQAYGQMGLLRSLKNCHPSGTLQDKVTDLLDELKANDEN